LIPVLTVGGSAFLAYALGYTLVIMGAGTIPSWTWTWSVGTITALMGLAALGFSRGEVDRQNMLAAACFVVTASAISITASLFKTHVLRRDFEMRAKLESMTKELTRANEELLRLSSTDPLTGLLNRRSLMERLELETARALRYQRALSVLVLDIDHFKRINDTLGHEAGDEALVLLATIVRSSVRGSDIAARLGGEEFVVVAPETAIEGAQVLAERLRAEIQLRASYTVSIGVASTESTEARTARALLAAADCALYRAKGAGRNCVVVDQPKFQPPLTTRLAPEM
jgi:diguanylate cyclase (GGDEF)-like protein